MTICVLAVLTLIVLVQTTGRSTPSAPAQAETANGVTVPNGITPGVGTLDRTATAAVPGTTSSALVPDPDIRDADGHVGGTIAAAALPAGADYVAAGAGTWHVVPGTAANVGAGSRVLTYTVEVEDGLPAELDPQFARVVDATLADPRSWIGDGQVGFTRIDKGDPDIRISLTSRLAIRAPANCGWDIPLEASCFNGWMSRVMINDARWTRGAMSYDGDLDAYRAYAINHEVGHALGNRHQPCPAAGAPAPIMMQQSWSTSNEDLAKLDPGTIPADGNECVANPYPFPDATAITSPTQSPSPAG